MTVGEAIVGFRSDDDALTQVLADVVNEIGYQPFIAIGIDERDRATALVCPTQNEALSFSEKLHELGLPRRSRFLSGLCAALEQDHPAALDHLAVWLEGCDDALATTIDFPTAATPGFAHCVGYPVFRLRDADPDQPDAAARRLALSALTTALAGAPGNDFLRWSLCEDIALALTQDAERSGDLASAGNAVASALTCLPGSAALLACQHRLRALGEPTPPAAMSFSQLVQSSTPRLLLEVSVLDTELADALAPDLSLAVLAGLLQRRGATACASLVQALLECQADEIYEASGSFFNALTTAASGFSLRLGGRDGSYHIHLREAPPASGDPEPTLTEAAYGVVDDFCRYLIAEQQTSLPSFLEALGLAVIRALCIGEQYRTAHDLTRRLLTITRLSIFLRSAETAVDFLIKGDEVPQHLQKFVAEDRDALIDRFCPVPFARADVHQAGTVAMCCTHWLPTSIGNVFDSSADQILNSPTAKAIRRSVVDGSFKFCSHTDCELIVNNKLPFKKDYLEQDFEDEYYHIDNALLRRAFDLESFEIPNLSYLVFCLDRTCNLTCPSCRTDLIMVKGEERDRLYAATERVVLPMLRNAKRVMVNPSGEAFVSRPSRRLLEQLGEPGYDGLIVDVITNGTVCTEDEWNKFAFLFGRLNIIRVSIDGASKTVIEKLRRGCKYEVLVENLTHLRRMHDAGHFKNFFMSFTYQLDNLFEMEEFVRFARSFGAGTVIFERLQNIGTFTADEYYARAVHLVDHPNHAEFLEIARRVKQDPIVYIDFDPGPAHGATSTVAA